MGFHCSALSVKRCLLVPFPIYNPSTGQVYFTESLSVQAFERAYLNEDIWRCFIITSMIEYIQEKTK